MYFLVHARDKSGALNVRLDNRDAHIGWLKAAGDRIKAAGPWLDENEAMAGSLLIVEFDKRAELDAWLATDPYALAGLFERVEAAPYKWVFNPPEDAA